MRFRCHRKRIYRFSSTLYRFNAFSTVHTKTLENDRITRWLVTWVELYVYARNTRTCDKIVHRFHFDVFSTVHTNTIWTRFGFDPLPRAFSNRCMRFYCISLDRRPKRIEMYAFSIDNALVWTRPETRGPWNLTRLIFPLRIFKLTNCLRLGLP